MKEFVLKHPVMTFLLVDSLIVGLFNTIAAFAPGRANTAKGPTDDCTIAEENKEEAE